MRTHSSLLLSCCLLFSLVSVGLSTDIYVIPQGGLTEYPCGQNSTVPCNGIILALNYIATLSPSGEYNVFLFSGTYGGALNVPFQINNQRISILGDTTDSSTIDCSSITTTSCVQVSVNMGQVSITFGYLNFVSFYPNPSSYNPLSVIAISGVNPSVFPDFEDRQDINFDVCTFTNNEAPPSPSHKWEVPSIVSAQSLLPTALIAFSSSVFKNNKMECIRSLYCSVVISNCDFENNSVVGKSYSIILSGALHPWMGLSAFSILNSRISFNSISSGGDQAVLSFVGAHCDIQLNCIPIYITNTSFTSNSAFELIRLDDGAQLSISESTIITSNTVYNGLISATSVVIPTYLNIDTVTFNSNQMTGGSSLLNGNWAEGSIITNSVVNEKFSSFVNVSGKLIIEKTEFTDCVYPLRVDKGGVLIMEYVNWNSSVANTTILVLGLNDTNSSSFNQTTIVSITRSSFNSSFGSPEHPVVLLNQYVNLMIANSTFSSPVDLFNCSSNVLIQFIGNETHFFEDSSKAKDSFGNCYVACNSENSNTCGGAVAITPSGSKSTGLSVWAQVVLIVTGTGTAIFLTVGVLFSYNSYKKRSTYESVSS